MNRFLWCFQKHCQWIWLKQLHCWWRSKLHGVSEGQIWIPLSSWAENASSENHARNWIVCSGSHCLSSWGSWGYGHLIAR